MRMKILTGAAALALVISVCSPCSGRCCGRRGGGRGRWRGCGRTVGAAVGGVGGAIVGGIADENKPKFREYVVKEHHPSYRYSGEVVVGAELPATGVTYYEVPKEYGTTQYRWAVVNEKTVLVDPRTHKIIEIIS